MGNKLSCTSFSKNDLMKNSSIPYITKKITRLIRLWIGIIVWIGGLKGDKLRLYKLNQDWKTSSSYPHALAILSLNLFQSTLRFIKLLVIPDILGRYFLAAVCMRLIYEMERFFLFSMKDFLNIFTKTGREIKMLQKKLECANTFEERREIGNQLDKLEGSDRWRSNPKSSLFPHQRVHKKMSIYKKLMKENDIIGLMFYLRAGLLRKHFGFGNPKLFQKSHVGTKHIIEEYMKTIVNGMKIILEDTTQDEDEDLSTANKLAFFAETRHAFGRSALLLSGGGALGLYHAGVIKALFEQNLLPSVISGSSAGSIVAAIVGARTDEELSKSFTFEAINTKFFGTNINEEAMEEWLPDILRDWKSEFYFCKKSLS